MKTIQQPEKGRFPSVKLFNQLPIGTIFAGNLESSRIGLFTYKKITCIQYKGINELCDKTYAAETHWQMFIDIISNKYHRCIVTLPSSKRKFAGQRLEKLSSNLSKRKA